MITVRLPSISMGVGIVCKKYKKSYTRLTNLADSCIRAKSVMSAFDRLSECKEDSFIYHDELNHQDFTICFIKGKKLVRMEWQSDHPLFTIFSSPLYLVVKYHDESINAFILYDYIVSLEKYLKSCTCEKVNELLEGNV